MTPGVMRNALLAGLLCAACQPHPWDGTYRDLDGRTCVLDEYPDSETGVIETYCRRSSADVVPSDAARVREIHVLWRHALRLYPDRLERLMTNGARVIYVDGPGALVPGAGVCVPWSAWPQYHDLGSTDPDGYRGFCCWAETTDDGLCWLIVATYQFSTPLPILAHELTHALFPELEHGTEFDVVIWSLLVGRTE